MTNLGTESFNPIDSKSRDEQVSQPGEAKSKSSEDNMSYVNIEELKKETEQDQNFLKQV